MKEMEYIKWPVNRAHVGQYVYVPKPPHPMHVICAACLELNGSCTVLDACTGGRLRQYYLCHVCRHGAITRDKRNRTNRRCNWKSV
jgi:hypothetical protein